MAEVKLPVIFLKSKTITDISAPHTEGRTLTELFTLFFLVPAENIIYY